MEIKKVTYDYKFNGVIVEVSQDNFDELSNEISKREGEKLKGKNITTVIYVTEETEEDKKKATKAAVFGILGTLLSMLFFPILIVIGLYQVGVWILNWIVN